MCRSSKRETMMGKKQAATEAVEENGANQGEQILPIPESMFQNLLRCAAVLKELIPYAMNDTAVNDWQIRRMLFDAGLYGSRPATQEDVDAGYVGSLDDVVIGPTEQFATILESFSPVEPTADDAEETAAPN